MASSSSTAAYIFSSSAFGGICTAVDVSGTATEGFRLENMRRGRRFGWQAQSSS
jgi:hypothetical protein